jgi:hypothetical protein
LEEELRTSISIREKAGAVLQSCPVLYISKAKLYGSLFGTVEDGSVFCADTGFWVDHGEPMAPLRMIREKGIEWPFGDLPEGHEFLVIAQGNI